MDLLLSKLDFLQIYPLLLGLLLSLVYFFVKSRRNQGPPLPGPWSLPFLGCVFLLPKFLSPRSRRRLLFSLPRTYGGVLGFQAGPLRIVWLNDMAAVKEAFVTKAEFFSDRIIPNSANRIDRLFGSRIGFGDIDYGRDFKERKQLILRTFSDFESSGGGIVGTIQEEADHLSAELSKIADAGLPTDAHASLFYLAVSNVISVFLFGERFGYEDPVFVKAIEGSRFLFKNRMFLEESAPLLRNLPAVRKREEKNWVKANDFMNLIQREFKRRATEVSAAPKGFVEVGLKMMSQGKISMSPECVKRIIVDLFFGGADTTASSLMWFLLYLIRFPEIQKKCQAEIDAVLGPDGDMTKFQPQKDFPYTVATLWETWRIACVAPLTLPHRSRENATVCGYRIPKDSLVFANIFYIHMNEENWADPSEFRPDRWLKSDDPSGTVLVQHRDFLPFSYGPRRCVGEKLARDEFCIFAINLLRKFSFEEEDPENPPELRGEGLLINTPIPYRMMIRKRLEGGNII